MPRISLAAPDRVRFPPEASGLLIEDDMRVVLLVGLLALAPSGASAQQTDPVAFWGATAGVGIPMLAVDTILFAQAIDAWASGRYGLDEEWAIVEVVWGAVHVVGAGIAIGVSTLAYDPVPAALTFSIPLGALGIYFLTHGFLSLFGESPDRK